jgi:hypothetical protein
MWGELHWSGDVRGSVWSNGMVARFPIVIHEELDEGIALEIHASSQAVRFYVLIYIS